MNVNKELLKRFMVYCERIDSIWAKEFTNWIDEFMQKQEGKCQGIEGSGCENDGRSLHLCPYKEDLWGEENTLCNCCDDCTTHCLHEI